MKVSAVPLLLGASVIFVWQAGAQQALNAKLRGPVETRTAAKLAHAETDERIKAYERRLRASPNDVRLQTGLISAYLQKLRESADGTYLQRASILVEKMLERDGGSFTALRLQNEIDLQRHNFKAVAERAQDMLKYAPSDPGAWGNLGDASMETGEYERAGQAYLKMFSLRPNLASYNRLAYFRFVAGDAQQGIELMKDAIAAGESQPENTAWCWAELGDMYFKTGMLNRAAEAYEAAIDLFPALHRASAGLGKVEASRNHIEGAIRNYEHAQSIVPMVEYASALEDLYAAAAMPKKALEQEALIRTIAKLGVTNNEKANRNLAMALADHQIGLLAALDLIEAEMPNRGDVYTWDAFSWILFKNGRTKEAETASRNALKLGTPEPLFYYHASKIALASGDARRAELYADRLISLNPNFDFAKSDLAGRNARIR
jgi:tetratricopeptide (TPR) repeat protein